LYNPQITDERTGGITDGRTHVLGKKLHQCHFVHINPTLSALGLNPALQSEKLEN
jgi:hypothetical protein